MIKEFTESKMIRKFNYNEDRQELIITFNTGKSYQYDKVPLSVVMDAISAPSVGQFVNEKIKGHFAYKQV